jgi:hypothetical protein
VAGFLQINRVRRRDARTGTDDRASGDTHDIRVPPRARATAVLRPIPRAAPVTTATSTHEHPSDLDSAALWSSWVSPLMFNRVAAR